MSSQEVLAAPGPVARRKSFARPCVSLCVPVCGTVSAQLLCAVATGAVVEGWWPVGRPREGNGSYLPFSSLLAGPLTGDTVVGILKWAPLFFCLGQEDL